MSDTEKSVSRILETYASAVYARNVTTFMHLYDPSVRVFDAWGVWSYEGSESWQRAVEGWFSSLGKERVKVKFSEVQTASAGPIVTLSAVVSYVAVSEQGDEIRTMENRITWVLKTIGHVLRIVHEHTSAPIGFEDMKAILSRQVST